MALSAQFLDELRTRTLLSALIGKSVKLQRAGREWRACCPFHNEKSPSFYVNDEKGFYHCFGCSAHGDAIRWMTEQRGLPFMDAVKELAQSAGMDVPAPDPQSQAREERASGLYGVVEAAQAWFVDQLNGIEGAEARAYLKKRGISDRTITGFGFGYAPDSRGKLKDALREFGNEQLIEAGLLIDPDSVDPDGRKAAKRDPYDRFRGRLMLPIRDQRGRVIAFGGRILGAGEPKYLNSPETPLFDKGRTLYNLDRAAPAARKTHRVVVVEGYMDVVALAQAGIEEAVAPLGTALTEMQLERLWRMSETPILCFDGDNAGQKASIRAIERALPHLQPGRSLRFLSLPAGQDPDDLIRAGGKQAIEALLEKPEPLADRLWRHELEAELLDTPEAKAGLRRRLNEHAKAIGDGDVRDQYFAEFRERFDTHFGQRRTTWQERRPEFRPRPFGKRWEPPERPVSGMARAISSGDIDIRIARAIFAGLLRHPSLIARCAEAISTLTIPDAGLDRLRRVMLDACFSVRDLDLEGLYPILADTGLDALARELEKTNGLAFSFTRSNADEEVARRDLAMAIEVLAMRPELDAALAAATARLADEPDEKNFDEQRRLREAREEADRRLATLAQGDDEIG